MKTDSELIIDFKEGNVDAFNELIKRYRLPLLKFLNSSQDASDLVQETFNKAYAKINTFNESSSSSFKCWLYRIARNCQIDASRKENRHQDFLNSLAQMQVMHANPPFAHLLKSEYSFQVRTCINELSEMQREVLIMNYYHDLKYNQIAEILGCSLSAVKTHMSRAVLKLSQTLPSPGKDDLL
jgi:RNA polymerase sigma factor (sigma-70 family)